MDSLRIVFAGTPPFAAAHLAALLDAGHNVVAVYTQPDRPAGRGKRLVPSPVKELAQHHGLPVYQPLSLKPPQESAALAALDPDLLVVVAYGLILPRQILDIPRLACLNVHASMLPRWRGAAPIERALLAGDKVTGISIMRMDEGLDTGDVLHQATVAIGERDNREQLLLKLTTCGQQALLYSLNHLESQLSAASAQDDSASCYAAKLSKEEACIDWNDAANQIDRQVRAGIGRAPAYSWLNGQRIRILAALPLEHAPDAPPGTIVCAQTESFGVACKESVLQVNCVQLPGKKAISVKALGNSRPELFSLQSRFTQASGAKE